MPCPLNHQNSEHIVEVRTIRTIGWFLREIALSQPTSHHVCDSNILISSHSQSICRLAQDFGWLGISDLDCVNVDREFVVTRIHLAQPAAEASLESKLPAFGSAVPVIAEASSLPCRARNRTQEQYRNNDDAPQATFLTCVNCSPTASRRAVLLPCSHSLSLASQVLLQLR